MFSNHEMCEITVPVNHYDVITFHLKSSANPRWNYTGNGRILRGSAAIRGGIKIFRGGIISGQVSGIAGGSEKSSAGVGGLVKIPLDCTVLTYTIYLCRSTSCFLAQELVWEQETENGIFDTPVTLGDLATHLILFQS